MNHRPINDPIAMAMIPVKKYVPTPQDSGLIIPVVWQSKINDNKGFAKINDDIDDKVSKIDVNTPISYCLSAIKDEM